MALGSFTIELGLNLNRSVVEVMKNSCLCMLSKIVIVEVNWKYLFISTSDQDKLCGIGKITQRATTLYLTKCFQFRCLLDQNELSIEIWKSWNIKLHLLARGLMSGHRNLCWDMEMYVWTYSRLRLESTCSLLSWYMFGHEGLIRLITLIISRHAIMMFENRSLKS
jgi:hypothetical protein